MSSCGNISTLVLSNVGVTHYTMGVKVQKYSILKKNSGKTSQQTSNPQSSYFIFPIVSRILGKEK